ncbi:M36 family metallopeptidase [Nocardioides sp.]|uniref:PLL-like beta propeller domain-containing protein n=1 Tax=metagenome TaxID=256318 RepID=A0A2P2BXA3_9ZZZZ
MSREVDVREITRLDDDGAMSRRIFQLRGNLTGHDPVANDDVAGLSAVAQSVISSVTGDEDPGAAHASRWRVESTVSPTSSGAVAVHFEQTFADIPVFQAGLTVRFSCAGLPVEVTGTVVGWSDQGPASPGIDPVDAVLVALKHLAEPDHVADDGLDSFGQPRKGVDIDPGSVGITISSAGDDAQRTTWVGLSPWSTTALVSLAWFDLGAMLVLGWQVSLDLPDAQGSFRLVVDSVAGEVLYSRSRVCEVVANAMVSAPNPDTAALLRAMPEPLSRYPVKTPSGGIDGFPRDDWITKDSTQGNCVSVTLDTGGEAVGSVVDGVIQFRPTSDEDIRRVAAQYFCSYAHDLFWLLGFKEGDGNFQLDDYDENGAEDQDRVNALVYPGKVKGTASMGPSVDGASPTLRMGLYVPTGRHTALDESVVIHEYTHGVVNRLVGGKTSTTALDAAQSAGMNEGWADYFACVVTGLNVVGSWVVNSSAGMRSNPYDQNYPSFYSDLAPSKPSAEEHDYGEIWCAALMEVDRRLGTEITAQLVLDALKLTPSNPTFLQARDAVLSALDDMATASGWTSGDAQLRMHEAWSAFARFGMGVLASSPASTTFVGVQPDFSVPSFSPSAYADSELEPYEPGGRQVGPTPGVSTWGPDRLDLFCSTSTGMLHTWHASDMPLGSVWESIDGATPTVGRRSGVAACSWEPGRIDAFIIGDDGTLHTLAHDVATGWGMWANLGGALDPGCSPAVASWAPGRLDVFAKGPAGELMHLWRDSATGWGRWESLDPFVGSRKLSSGLSATAPAPGRLVIAGLSVQGYPQVCDYDVWLGTWTRWNLAHTASPAAGDRPAPAITASIPHFLQSPSPTSRRPVDVDLYAIAPVDGTLQITHSHWSRSWDTTSRQHPAGNHRGLGVAAWSEKRLDLVVADELPSGDLTRIGRLVHQWTNSAAAPPQSETLDL